MSKPKFRAGEKLWHICVEPFSFDPDVAKVSDKPYEVYNVRFISDPYNEWRYYCHWFIDQCAEEPDLFRDKNEALAEAARRNKEKGVVPLTKEQNEEIINAYLGRSGKAGE